VSEPNGEKVFVQLEAEKLILKSLEMSDKEFIFKQFSDPDVTRSWWTKSLLLGWKKRKH
jgi:hypothetical protein